MLETLSHPSSTFVTLTYRPEDEPEDRCVTPKEATLFIRRLRRHHDVRYFAVGEYGEDTGRPHYHLALFNYPECTHVLTQYDKQGHVKCCAQCLLLEKLWGKGRIQNAQLTEQSIQYVAGYIVKRMTRDDDPRLEGRLPEFARMSLRPGIGHDMMYDVASTLMHHNLDEKLEDVPTTLQHGKKVYPLGRYLRKKLRKMVGRDEKTPLSIMEKQAEKMRPLREAAFEASTPFRLKVLEASEGRRIQIEAREKRNNKKVTL